MTDLAVKQDDRPVLARMIAAHAANLPSPQDLGPVAERGFSRAMRHAAVPFDGLGLEVTAAQVATKKSLAACLESVPEHGLLAVLEDAEGRRGLLALSHGLVDALIEVQTTGKVEATALPPRSVTRIDEALTRDYLDLFLSALARETEEIEGRDWPHRMAFGSTLADRDRLTLLIPDRDHVLFSAEIGFRGTDRTARIRLVLPIDTGLTMPRKQAHGADPERLKDWQTSMARVLSAAPLSLDAVLLRLTRPLGEVMSLEVGTLLPFAASDLAQVSLEDSRGEPVLQGRLGQIGGKRAVRLPDADAIHAVDEASAAPPQPQPSAAAPSENPVGAAAAQGLAKTDLATAPEPPPALPEAAL